MAVPVRLDLLADLQVRAGRIAAAVARMQAERRLHVAGLGGRLPDVASLAGAARQRLDDRGHRLGLALPSLLAARAAALVRAERALPDAPALLRGGGAGAGGARRRGCGRACRRCSRPAARR